jgi:hypothetical protein
MKFVSVGRNKKIEIEIPETWAEGETMLTQALGPYYDERGRNIMRLSIAARVAYGLFGEKFLAADPTTALLYLLQRICIRKGAGLEK